MVGLAPMRSAKQCIVMQRKAMQYGGLFVLLKHSSDL